jgi:hypothetical protein
MNPDKINQSVDSSDPSNNDESEPKTEPKSEHKGVRKFPGLHGGTLQTGTPGNKGGPGRPRESLRNRLRTQLDKRGIKVIKQAMQSALESESGSASSMKLALQATDIAARYGLGEVKSIDEGIIPAIASLASDFVPEDRQAAYVEAVKQLLVQFTEH